MIAYLLLILLVAILAYFEGKREARLIAERIAGDIFSDLDHGILVMRRMLILSGGVVLPWMGFCIAMGSDLNTWTRIALLLFFAAQTWATFTIAHRFTMNAARKMDWRFVANSSWFDRQCLRVCGVLRMDTKLFNRRYHEKGVNGGGYRNRALRDGIHRAGLLSYLAIALVLAASIVGVVAILNH